MEILSAVSKLGKADQAKAANALFCEAVWLENERLKNLAELLARMHGSVDIAI